jgi:TfoX/Sxy family transcriptional regulator of competence genes
MFGCPCAFVNGQMFAGMPEDRLIVRVPEEAPMHPGALKGRTMKEYAMIADAVGLRPEAMARWVARGYAFALTLPPKPAKATAGNVKLAARAA